VACILVGRGRRHVLRGGGIMAEAEPQEEGVGLGRPLVGQMGLSRSAWHPRRALFHGIVPRAATTTVG
jgi:hypothetical protein